MVFLNIQLDKMAGAAMSNEDVRDWVLKKDYKPNVLFNQILEVLWTEIYVIFLCMACDMIQRYG